MNFSAVFHRLITGIKISLSNAPDQITH